MKKISILSKERKQSGESFCRKTLSLGTSEEVIVTFLILKMHMGVSKLFAQSPSAAGDKAPLPLNPTTTLASTV